MMYGLLADTILIVHVLFIVFVVLGLILTIIGGFLHWSWVRKLTFRIAHLLAIGVVVAEAWSDIICPLTAWEHYLRQAAGQATYTEGFIEHWLHRLIFFDAPTWVFTVAYTIFGLLVLLTWIFVRPRFGRNAESTSSRTLATR